MAHGSLGGLIWDSQDLGAQSTSINVPTAWDEPETTTMNPTGAAKTFEPGLESGTVELEMIFTAALVAILESRRRQILAFTYTPAGSTTGLRRTTGTMFLTAFSQVNDVNDVVKISASFRISAAITHDTVP